LLYVSVSCIFPIVLKGLYAYFLCKKLGLDHFSSTQFFSSVLRLQSHPASSSFGSLIEAGRHSRTCFYLSPQVRIPIPTADYLVLRCRCIVAFG
jgi:hypothetical protein